MAEQAPSCVIRGSGFLDSEELSPAVLEAVELMCNTPVTGHRTSASRDGTRHIAFRLGDESGFSPASVGLWTEPAVAGKAVRVLSVLGGFPAIGADSSGAAHLVRIESGAAIYYRCREGDPSEWSRELVKVLSDDEYPTDIAVDFAEQPRVLLQRRSGALFIAQRKRDARWRSRSLDVNAGVITSSLSVDPDGSEHVAFWSSSSAGQILGLHSSDASSFSNPRAVGHGLSLRTVDMPGASKRRAAIAFKGALTPHRDGVHVLVPARKGGHIDVLQQLPDKAISETCSKTAAKGRVKRCERRVASLGQPTIAATGDGWIWAVHASTLRVNQVKIELPDEAPADSSGAQQHRIPQPGKTKRAPFVPLRETIVDSQAMSRLTLTRISVVDGSAEVRMRLDWEVVEGRSLIAPQIEVVGDELHVLFKSARNALTLLRIDPSATKVVALPETSPERFDLFRHEADESRVTGNGLK
jgi:hypothetical protein